MRFSTFHCIRHISRLLGVGLLALGCGAKPSTADVSRPVTAVPSSAAVAVVVGALPERAEAVASADAWAVEGNKLGGPVGGQRLLDAAALRERIFRVEHREADALEAIELYRQAAHEPELHCSAGISAALLEGELRSDPASTFRAVYRAQSASGADATCQARAADILSTLTAYRPLPTVLAQLAADGDASARPDAPMPTPLSASSPSAQTSDDVIVPALGAPHGPARVTKIERYGAPDAARVVVYVTEPSTYKVGFLDEGGQSPRLFVDIEGATYQGAKSFDVGGLVSKVRVGAEANRTRVVLDLTAAA
jgi:N-acetylmuramoyl-L-alanine amidase